MAVALLYNLSDAKKLAALRFAFVKCGVRARTVAPEEYSHPIGYLCGFEGFLPAETAEGGFSEEMLVLGAFSPQQLDALLNILRARRVNIALKAAVTEENAAWSSLRLHGELRREHEAMHAQQKES